MFDQIFALALFAFVSTFTPGPNNMMLMASGANIGLGKTIPHILGVAFGFGFMIFLVGIGAQSVFSTIPLMHDVLKWGSTVFLCYLALKIAMSKPQLKTQKYRPMSFLSAALFQWVNPKGWSMALSAVSLYNPTASLFGLVIITTTFIVVNIPSCTSWAYAGEKISAILDTAVKVRCFNLIMATLLIGSTLPMLQG